MRFAEAYVTFVRAWLAVAALAIASLAHANVKETLQLAPGGFRYVLTERAEGPKADRVLVMLTGGDGALGLQVNPDGTLASPPTENRGWLAEAVGAVATLDVQSPLDLETRQSDAHGEALAKVIEVIGARMPGAKVYVMGWSNGAISAVNVAGKVRDKLAGVIVMSGSGYAVNRERLDAIKAPVLIVHHRRDTCTEWKPIADTAKWYTTLLVDDDTLPRPGASARDCGPTSAHLFGAKRRAVFQAVGEWVTRGKTVSTL